MKILVACEESQTLTKNLRRLGHEAYSCDIIDQSGGHPEWHIMQDVIPLLNGRCSFQTTDGVSHNVPGRWDALICFPPCTDLTNSGARHFAKKRANGQQRKAVMFFCSFLSADCEIIVIENPVGIISGDYVKIHFPDLAEKYDLPRKPTQIIQPWQFALSEDEITEKTTCLWIKGGKALVPIRTQKPDIPYKEWTTADGRIKRQTLWYYKTRCLPYEERGRVASKTFPGIGKAIAEQIIGECINDDTRPPKVAEPLNTYKPVKERIEAEGYEEVVIFENYSYDTAFMGVTECNRAVYDYDEMVAWLMRAEGLTEIEAIEWIDYNTIRSLDYSGPNGPLILYRIKET